MTDFNPYDMLGVSPDSTPEEIRAAFRRAVRERHPDTSLWQTDGTAVRDIIEAYHLLADPVARARYDAAHASPDVTVAGPRPIRIRHSSTGRGVRSAARASCPGCRGAGIVQSIVTCPACHGRAEITSLETTRARILRCRRCRGAGRIRSLETCGYCHGTGRAATNR